MTTNDMTQRITCSAMDMLVAMKTAII